MSLVKFEAINGDGLRIGENNYTINGLIADIKIKGETFNFKNIKGIEVVGSKGTKAVLSTGHAMAMNYILNVMIYV